MENTNKKISVINGEQNKQIGILQNTVETLQKLVDKIDTRLWWLVGIMLVALIGIVATFFRI